MSPTQEETIARLKEQAEAAAEDDEDMTEAEAVYDREPEEGKEPKVPKDSKREYIVFQAGAKGEWLEITRAVASSAGEAIETLGEHLKDKARYAAIPSRNWHEKTAAVETTTTIKLK